VLTGGDFKFQHLETEDDIAQHLELMRKVFGQDGRIDVQVRKWIDHHPKMLLKDFFAIKHQDQIVAGLNAIPSEWSVGGIPIKVAELGCVATLPEYRHQGLQRRLMEEYHKQISDQGYDLSAIEGIPFYYRQFGYEYALPLQEETRLKLDQIPDFEIKHKIRPFTKADVPRATQLLSQAQLKFHVHTIREEGIWKMQQETGMIAEYKFEGYAVEESGEMIAYFIVSVNPQGKELLLREITGIDADTARSILRFLKDKGKRDGLETLLATISYYEPFAAQMAAIGGTQNPPYAWQIRAMDYAKLLWKLEPLLDKRLAESMFRHLTEKLNFNFYSHIVQIAVENGFVADVKRVETDEDRSIRFNPLVFIQLLLGYRNREELQAIYPDFLVRTTRRHLIDVLFPKLPSYIHTEY